LHGLVPESFETYQVVDPGDIIVRTTDLQNDQTSLRVGHSPYRGIITSAYLCLETTNKVSREYGYQILNAYDLLKIIYGYGSGLRQNLDFSHIKRMPVFLPPLAEQQAIVRYLDYMDLRIRRYIRAKQKLIKLLEEQKAAIIHRAVTRGLDPNVRLKPSGVEWLGDIPEHWQVRKLKHLANFRNGLAFKPADWSSNGVPIIRIQNLNGSEQFNYTTRNDLPLNLLISKGDLLFSWSGNRGTSFGSYVWDREFSGYLNQHIFKLEDYYLQKSYFAHLLRAVTKYIEERTHGIIGLVHVTKPELGAVLVPVAPLEEQSEIAHAIDSKVAAIGSIATCIRKEINLLRESHTRLIADVVTGKLDVREAAARLPEEAEAFEAIEETENGGEIDEGMGEETEINGEEDPS